MQNLYVFLDVKQENSFYFCGALICSGGKSRSITNTKAYQSEPDAVLSAVANCISILAYPCNLLVLCPTKKSYDTLDSIAQTETVSFAKEASAFIKSKKLFPIKAFFCGKL